MALTTIATSPLFGSLGPGAADDLRSELTHVRLKGGETLFSAGEPGDSLYVVVSGRLRALLPDDGGGLRILGEIGRGESVGEMALLTGEPRSATVCAIRDTELIRLSRTGFEEVLARQPMVMLDMTRQIIERYRRMLRPAVETRPVTLAIVPCGPDVPVDEFASGLVRALSPGRKVLALDEAALRRERGEPHDRQTELDSQELAGWLHEQELRHDFLVYVADARPWQWTRLCVRQADVVLAIGRTGAAARLDPRLQSIITAGATETGARRELVLLYDRALGEPRGTADWLARLPVSDHHHLDPRAPGHYDRLARLLTGRAIGLVLGGGGARGLAHIGVIRAIEEAGIPIDLVGGTSAGAIVGGQYACGLSSAEILDQSRRVMVEDGSLNDYTLPVLAILRGRRYVRMLEKLFGHRHIEDLPLPFFCVSTNLTRSACMVHRRGLLFRRVAASCAVPGLGPPIIDGRDILVDGGVVNNLPVDVMRGLGRGPVFASSVSPQSDLCLDRDYVEFPSPWRVLASWVNPLGRPLPVPSITSTLMRTVSLPRLTTGLTAHERADLFFQSPCEHHKLLDWRAIDRIMETGYRAAVPVVERWQAQAARATRDAALTP